MNKNRLLKSITAVWCKIDEVGEILIHSEDIAKLDKNRQEAFIVLCDGLSQDFSDIKNKLRLMMSVLKAEKVKLYPKRLIEVKKDMKKP